MQPHAKRKKPHHELQLTLEERKALADMLQTKDSKHLHSEQDAHSSEAMMASSSSSSGPLALTLPSLGSQSGSGLLESVTSQQHHGSQHSLASWPSLETPQPKAKGKSRQSKPQAAASKTKQQGKPKAAASQAKQQGKQDGRKPGQEPCPRKDGGPLRGSPLVHRPQGVPQASRGRPQDHQDPAQYAAAQHRGAL